MDWKFFFEALFDQEVMLQQLGITGDMLLTDSLYKKRERLHSLLEMCSPISLSFPEGQHRLLLSYRLLRGIGVTADPPLEPCVEKRANKKAMVLYTNLPTFFISGLPSDDDEEGKHLLAHITVKPIFVHSTPCTYYCLSIFCTPTQLS